jgi:hypothetical protein
VARRLQPPSRLCCSRAVSGDCRPASLRRMTDTGAHDFDFVFGLQLAAAA